MPARFTASPRSARSIRYSQKVYAASPGNLIGFWPMWEDSGGVAVDYSGRGNDGAYTSVGLGQPGIGSGRTSAFFNGSTSLNNVYSAGLGADFNGAEGALLIWARVSGAGVWTDGTIRDSAIFGADNTANYVLLRKHSDNNTFQWIREGANTRHLRIRTTLDTGWFTLVLTWSEADDEVRAYHNGVQEGATFSGLGSFTGSLDSSNARIGDSVIVGTSPMDGFLAYGALWGGIGAPAAIQAAMSSLGVP